MQRKTSKNRNGRGPNASEVAFQRWLKDQPCVWCGNDGPSIVDHCRGATYSHNKVHIGHWFCIPQCFNCDMHKTIHGKRQGNESAAWTMMALIYPKETPWDVWNSIQDFNK